MNWHRGGSFAWKRERACEIPSPGAGRGFAGLRNGWPPAQPSRPTKSSWLHFSGHPGVPLPEDSWKNGQRLREMNCKEENSVEAENQKRRNSNIDKCSNGRSLIRPRPLRPPGLWQTSDFPATSGYPCGGLKKDRYGGATCLEPASRPFGWRTRRPRETDTWSVA